MDFFIRVSVYVAVPVAGQEQCATRRTLLLETVVREPVGLRRVLLGWGGSHSVAVSNRRCLIALIGKTRFLFTGNFDQLSNAAASHLTIRQRHRNC